ncbi:hypothetical protein [Microbacterium sp. Leaf436]|uniref:hypothetical protein n=1 Tax=Microbacterium sp. Leaf436 TaxID=1736377 RepID=UPI000B1E4FDE|nr:hypothetical protein [Microbacterium sp. Leaf436]
MPAVSGNVRTWGFDAFPAGERLLVSFAPSSAGVSVSALLPLRQEHVEPGPDGSFTLNLAATTAVTPDAWYAVRFEWFATHPITGEWASSGWSELPGQLRVPAAGGDISSLLEFTPRPGSILYGYGPPPSSLSGVIYLDVSGDRPKLYAPKGALI